MKHYQIVGSAGQEPAMLVEARLNLRDVRSGYRDTHVVLLSGPILEESELGWTEDMVTVHSWQELDEAAPPRALEPAAELAEQKAIDYLLRCYNVVIWHNSALGLYSDTGEQRTDFEIRCREEATARSSDNLQQVQDIYLHRFLELEQRALDEVQAQQWEPDVLHQKLAATRDAFSDVRDDVSRAFLRRGLTPLQAGDFRSGDGLPVEAAERLRELTADFIRRYGELHDDIIAQSGQIDEYLVPVGYSEVRIELSAVVWK